MLKKIFKPLAVVMMCSAVTAQSVAQDASTAPDQIAPVKHIDVYVTPYYQAAQSLEGRPSVQVADAFDEQLASSNKGDILAVRDAIQAEPQHITPMTMMVLAIRLYDVDLRDDAVFWFYAAKNRFITMTEVLDVNSPELFQAADAVKNFAILAGPFINSYAFCDIEKQHEANMNSIDWVEQNPYEVMFLDQLSALPGDRAENLKDSISSLRQSALDEKQYFDDPANLKEFQDQRKERHMIEKFCWSN